MVNNKSLDPYKRIISTLLSDVQTLHSSVFTPRALQLTIEQIERRCAREGVGFLTKTLPRLGKAFDRALSGEVSLDYVGWDSVSDSVKLPKFLGELFQCVFSCDGMVLPTPCVTSIKHLRQVFYLFYKLELPYSPDDEANVINLFVKTESDIASINNTLSLIADNIDNNAQHTYFHMEPRVSRVIRNARKLLFEVFRRFDPSDIRPRHGPGAVSTRECLWEKYIWTRINPRIDTVYPFDAYFCASLGHICDSYKDFASLKEVDAPARVILVPKDSRGPRLISCEPLEFQWVQQGLGDAIVRHVERHKLTACHVNFTNQQPNQIAALFGSRNGRYATLDLKEASDRVTVGLVRLLFPEPLLRYLLNCRSQATTLPDGSIIHLNKFAPMGSALCFPILALCVWAILTSSEPDADARESILVYGGDVIVKTAKAENAMKWLEAFGLLVNRDKSCTSGFFRESCGMDAYLGICVTPVRIRTVWAKRPSPNVYTSYIAYANSMFEQHFFRTYDLIVEELLRVYREIPEYDGYITCPSLIEVPEYGQPKRLRTNKRLQRRERLVWDVAVDPVCKEINGWSMLLRYFAEVDHTPFRKQEISTRRSSAEQVTLDKGLAFSVRLYTRRGTGGLVRRWR